ncbi:unnamed protein product [Moneuplotes crassus]|uniref:MORN repeat protein n=1 Tax=Euplotes crassus TaxID=5936 RepID=A0AAD1XMV6_EUPCR|nr:unnamed protein product [Moneuplotes crassus]
MEGAFKKDSEELVQKSLQIRRNWLSTEEYQKLTSLLKDQENLEYYISLVISEMEKSMTERLKEFYSETEKPEILVSSPIELEFRPLTHIEDDKVYFGQWRKKTGQIEGRGLLKTTDNEFYQGSFDKGIFEGDGFLMKEFYNSCYRGEFKEGNFEGEGFLFNSADVFHKGGFKNNLFHGFGVQGLRGRTFEGYFVEGKREGHGRYSTEPGTYFECDWKNDSHEDYIVCNWANGAQYFGEFKNYKKEGKGHVVKADGARAVGTWVESEFESGIYTDSKGREFKVPDEKPADEI